MGIGELGVQRWPSWSSRRIIEESPSSNGWSPSVCRSQTREFGEPDQRIPPSPPISNRRISLGIGISGRGILPSQIHSLFRSPWDSICRTVAIAIWATLVFGDGSAAGQEALRTGFVMLGEARSSETADKSIEFAPRLFTIYLLEEACEKVDATGVSTLKSQPATVAMHVGRSFSPSTPPSDATGLGPRVPVKAGAAVFRARTLCPGPETALLIPAEVSR